jgi:hypothetical protein
VRSIADASALPDTSSRGPAIDSESFRVEGHCCGIRIPALMDPDSAGVRFEVSPEVRAELLAAGIRLTDAPADPPHHGEPP